MIMSTAERLCRKIRRILRAISQPRTLSADIPARQKGVYLFCNPPNNFHITTETCVNIFWLFCTFQNSICNQLLSVTIARISKTSLVSFHVKKDKGKTWYSGAHYVSFPRKHPRDKYRCRWGLLCDNCTVSFHHVTSLQIAPKLMEGL